MRVDQFFEKECSCAERGANIGVKGLMDPCLQACMAENTDHHSLFLGYGSLVGVLIVVHVAVLGFWFLQLARGAPPAHKDKKEQ